MMPLTAETIGTVVAVDSSGPGWTVTVGDAASILTDVALGDSISVNGTCLTVTAFTASAFTVGIAPETLRRTNLGQLAKSSPVNLERAVSAVAKPGSNSRFGGHIVQGHV